MNKNIFQIISIILLLTIFQNSYGQIFYRGDIIDNRHFQDCDGNIYSTFDFLADGRPLIIFTSAVDCGYCFDEAPEVGKTVAMYKDKINFVFGLIPQDNSPKCTSVGAGDHDWPGDWVSRYPGYEYAVSTIQPGNDHYFMIDCGVTTSFGAIHPFTKKIIGAGCRADGSVAAINAAMALYTDGTLKRFDNSVAKLQMSITSETGGKKVTITTSTSGSEIYYTTDGSVPSINAKKYVGPFVVNSTCLVKAIAYKANMNNSGVLIKFVEQTNAAYKNIAGEGIGYEWVSNKDATSNANKKSLSSVNDGKFVDVSLNGGANETLDDVYEAFGVVWNSVRDSITAIKLTHSTPKETSWSGKDYYALNMTIQTTMDGITWKNLEIGHYPEYPYGVDQIFQIVQGPMNIFTDKPFSAKGVRISGQVNINSNYGNGAANYGGLKELEIFTSDKVTAIDHMNSAEGISLFPNPSKGVFDLQLPNDHFSEVNITDMTGRTVFTHTIKSNATDVIEVNINGVQKGIYIISAKGETTLRKKIVIE